MLSAHTLGARIPGSRGAGGWQRSQPGSYGGKLWFTQNLEPAFSAVEIQDAEGKVVEKTDAHLDAQNKSLFLVSVPSLPAGTYTVIWHVVSVDTHKTQGRFKFTVKPKS